MDYLSDNHAVSSMQILSAAILFNIIVLLLSADSGGTLGERLRSSVSGVFETFKNIYLETLGRFPAGLLAEDRRYLLFLRLISLFIIYLTISSAWDLVGAYIAAGGIKAGIRSYLGGDGYRLGYLPACVFFGVLYAYSGWNDRHVLKNHPIIVFMLAALVVVGGWIGWIHLMLWLSPAPETSGEFGDSFGGFTALVTALGFAGVAATLYLQNRQMEDDRLRRYEEDSTRVEELGKERAARAAAERLHERQIKYLSQQLQASLQMLTIMERDRQREREQLRESCQPCFKFTLSVNDHGWSWNITNTGGAIKDIAVLESPPLSKFEGLDNLEYQSPLNSTIMTGSFQEGDRLIISYTTTRGGFRDSRSFTLRGN